MNLSIKDLELTLDDLLDNHPCILIMDAIRKFMVKTNNIKIEEGDYIPSIPIHLSNDLETIMLNSIDSYNDLYSILDYAATYRDEKWQELENLLPKWVFRIDTMWENLVHRYFNKFY